MGFWNFVKTKKEKIKKNKTTNRTGTNNVPFFHLFSDRILQEIDESLDLCDLKIRDKKLHTKVMRSVVELISSSFGLRIMKELSEEEAEDFNHIADGNLYEMEMWIFAKRPNAYAIFEEEVQKPVNSIKDERLRDEWHIKDEYIKQTVDTSKIEDEIKDNKYQSSNIKQTALNENTNTLEQLINKFLSLNNKEQAWNDLVRRISDENSSMKCVTVSPLFSAFSYVPDKEQAWNDLHRLTSNKNNSVRLWAVSILCYAFSSMPDKEQAWNDLHRLTADEDSSVRWGAASALCYAFSSMPDK
jgi:hypothetical protein